MIETQWLDLKWYKDAVVNASLNYIDGGGNYQIFLSNGPFQMRCTLKKKDTATAEQTDFETNYKPSANLNSLDESGRPLNRTAMTTNGWAFQACSFEFETSKLSSQFCKDLNGDNVPGVNMSFYDINDVELVAGTQAELDSSCVKTIFDIELNHSFDIIGGDLCQHTRPTVDVRLWCIAVPRIPAPNGEKEMIRGLNLKFLPGPGGVKYDGKAALRMTYDATYHTNEKRFLITHPAGHNHQLMGTFEFFKA